MIQRLSEPVSVALSYNHQSRQVRPLSLRWSGRLYQIEKVGLRHTYRDGATRHHIFSVVGGKLFFRLNLNADNLQWTLEEISDGLPD